MNLAHAFLEACTQHAGRTAALEPGAPDQPERALTFTELQQQVMALGAALQRLSGKEQPTCALLCVNSLDMLVAILAVYATGGVLVPLTPKNPVHELSDQISVAQPDLIIADPFWAERFSGLDIPVIETGKASPSVKFSLRRMIAQYDGQRPVASPVEPEQTAAIKFTGGSSGKPKGVMQSFTTLTTMVSALRQVYGFAAGEKFLVGPPLTHGAGGFVLPVLETGGCLVIMDAPRADAYLDAMATYRISSCWVPPTLLYQLIDQQVQKARTFPQLRQILYGGAGATQTRLMQACEVFGHKIGTTYGLTEAPMILAGMRGEECADRRNMGTAGCMAPGTQLAVMSPDGKLCPPFTEGEIVARGGLLMSGYLNMQEETAKTIVDGWLHTGDVGYLDQRDYLFIKGRIKDVIISGGFNIYPSDVEAALASHPAVAESVVYGLPDAHWGERVEATVELKANASASEAELLAYARERLGAVRTPKALRISSSLPRNALGKVQKKVLRQALIDAQTVNASYGAN